MFRRSMFTAMCLCLTTSAFGAEPILRSLTTDGKKMVIHCDVEGVGDVNEGKILKALDHIDASIDPSKKTTKKDRNGRMTIELPAKTPAFTMTHWETRNFNVIDGKMTERRTRTYFFAFDEEQKGVPISLGDFKNFIRQSAKGSNEEVNGEKSGDKCFMIELRYSE